MNIFHPILYFLLVVLCFSCRHKNIGKDSELLEKLDSLYVWDIEPELNGAMMFLDVAYKKADTCITDFLTMSLAKHKTQTRPDWIAVILPDNIIREEGAFLFFDENKAASSKLLNKKGSIRVNLAEHRDDSFVIRFKDGFATIENNQKVDVLQKLLESDRVSVMVFYPDGKHKTILIPLKHFRKRYKELE